jgi:hypothetical protein
VKFKIKLQKIDHWGVRFEKVWFENVGKGVHDFKCQITILSNVWMCFQITRFKIARFEIANLIGSLKCV